MITILLKSLFAVFAIFFGAAFAKDLYKTNLKQESGNFWLSSAIGGVTYFFDTLGIGSFATSTVLLRNLKQVSDKLLPGTLNATCPIPAFIEAIIFMSIIQVDSITLISMVATAAIGGWLGASYVAKLSEQKIRIFMAIALLITGFVMIAKQAQWLPLAHSDALGLTGIKLIIASVATAIIGALSSVGIGFFAPTLSVAYLLGMSAKATFPIMMSGCAICTAASGLKFIKAGVYNRKVTLAMTWCAVIGVLLAAYIVKSLPLNILNWLVVVVIWYTSFTLFLAYYRRKQHPLPIETAK